MYFTDEILGTGVELRAYAINSKTGEVLEEVHLEEASDGSILRTPEQIKASREYFQRLQAKDDKQRRKGRTHEFTFMKLCTEYDIEPRVFTKLVMLSTYLEYNSTRLIFGAKHMTKGTANRILQLRNDMTASRFWNDAIPEYLSIDDDGYIHMNCDIWKRGRLGSHPDSHTKIFNQAIRSLYKRTPITSHRMLGRLFMLLPYMNFESNVLCAEPFTYSYTEQADEIRYMTVRQLGALLGLEKSMTAESKVYRLISKISKDFKFEVDGEEKQLLEFSFDRSLDDCRIIINPNIIYGGSNIERVIDTMAYMARGIHE